MEALTPREQEIFNYILRFRTENQMSPSVREIAQGVGVYSPSAIHRHLHNMAEKGWLTMKPGSARSIVPRLQ